MAQPNYSSNPNMNRSLDYLNQKTFSADSETYQEFLKILKEYYDAFRSDIEEVVAKHKAAKEGPTAETASTDGSPDDVSKKRAERTTQALEDVKKLFAGHDDLIKGFEEFLPNPEKQDAEKQS
ncbi:hypothetical protein TruAng_004460 [Truncatella angustata]|nr:hypothetical protein TruAng_004460 [Truncatella angustata]